MLFYWLLVVILKFSSIFGDEEHRRVIRQDGIFYHYYGDNCIFPRSSTCTTPENAIGTCINLKSCPSLLTLLQTRGREPNIAAFLRKSHCGNSENNEPKVCCPRGSSTSTTRRTITTQSTRIIQTGGQTSRIVQTGTEANTREDYSQCGRSEKKATRIIGGQNATLADWPWMVALGYRTSTNPGPQFKCGASLLSNRWVVTAAHCVSNIGTLVLTTARVGDLDLSDNGQDNATPIDVPVDEIIPHPDYNTNPITNDIALVRLRNPVTFTRLIRPICILSEAEHRSDGYYANKLPFIIGWGATEWRGPTTNVLQEAQVAIVDNERCAQKYLNQKSSLIDQRVLCAGENGKDTCQGDSGGPLIVPNGNTYYLAGVVSYGIRCADSNYPGVYTRVAYFADWIRNTARL